MVNSTAVISGAIKVISRSPVHVCVKSAIVKLSKDASVPIIPTPETDAEKFAHAGSLSGIGPVDP